AAGGGGLPRLCAGRRRRGAGRGRGGGRSARRDGEAGVEMERGRSPRGGRRLLRAAGVGARAPRRSRGRTASARDRSGRTPHPLSISGGDGPRHASVAAAPVSDGGTSPLLETAELPPGSGGGSGARALGRSRRRGRRR